SFTAKVPKPISVTWSPFFSASVIASTIESRARPAAALEISADAAIASISSDLFTLNPLDPSFGYEKDNKGTGSVTPTERRTEREQTYFYLILFPLTPRPPGSPCVAPPGTGSFIPTGSKACQARLRISAY